MVPQLSPREVAARLAADDPPLLLDVRTPHEYALAAIEGAVFLPMHELTARIDELDPDRPTIVMCHHGLRSLNVARYLADRGYDPTMGARPMQRLIRDMIRRALADELLFGRLTDGGRLSVDLDDKDEVVLDIQPPKKSDKPKAETAPA